MIKRFFRPKVLFFGLAALAFIAGAFAFGVETGVPFALQARATALDIVHNVVVPMIPSVIFWGAIGLGVLLLLFTFYEFIVPRERTSKPSPVPKSGGPGKM